MNEITIKKIGENAEGPIREVKIDGEPAGHITKWKGLFESRTGDGTAEIHDTQKDAVEALRQVFFGERW